MIDNNSNANKKNKYDFHKESLTNMLCAPQNIDEIDKLNLQFINEFENKFNDEDKNNDILLTNNDNNELNFNNKEKEKINVLILYSKKINDNQSNIVCMCKTDFSDRENIKRQKEVLLSVYVCSIFDRSYNDELKTWTHNETEYFFNNEILINELWVISCYEFIDNIFELRYKKSSGDYLEISDYFNEVYDLYNVNLYRAVENQEFNDKQCIVIKKNNIKIEFKYIKL